MLEEEEQEEEVSVKDQAEVEPASQESNEEMVPNENEGSFSFSIRDIGPFWTCLESVKFPESSSKNAAKDIIFQALSLGIVLKSADTNGNVMTWAMIKKSYFADDDYKVKGPPHKYDWSGNPKNPADPLI